MKIKRLLSNLVKAWIIIDYQTHAPHKMFEVKCNRNYNHHHHFVNGKCISSK